MLEQMLIQEDVDFNKQECKAEIAQCKTKLVELQQKIKEEKIPVIILFEGWGASGKGHVIAKTINCLDPRSFKVYSNVEATDEEKRMPLMKRYWDDIPERGRFSILDRSWYQEIVPVGIENDICEEEKLDLIKKFNVFERQLTDDGYVVIKFFLQISQEEQKRRFKKLLDNEETNWRVTSLDLKRNRKYDKYLVEYDKMLDATNTENAPWTVVDAKNKTKTALTVYKTIIEAISAKIEGRTAVYGEKVKRRIAPEAFNMTIKKPLEFIDLSRTVDEEKYEEELKIQQKRLSKLHSILYAKKLPVVIGFEGWDAAGKGGTIRRVSQALDPRGFEAIPIAAPAPFELNRHYLWRFWQHIAKSGHIAIFDRTWYGRVMVERLEGFTDEKRWRQAYQEINEFENELFDSNVLVLKFWLHIDKDEQLRRFNDRMNTPEKRWKITDEDWRNREKWDKYEVAVNEMIAKTSTDFAPWHIIPNNDKKFGRLLTLRIINDSIESWIDRHSAVIIKK